MTRLGIEPRSPGPLVNTQLIRPMAHFFIIQIKKISESKKNKSLNEKYLGM